MDEKKHAPPISCRIRRAIVSPSPSAMCARCTLGLRRECSKCEGCTENVAEQWQESFMAGLEEGKKNPRYKIDESGKVHVLREPTPEEVEMMAALRCIVERAFPGIYDEEDIGT